MIFRQRSIGSERLFQQTEFIYYIEELMQSRQAELRQKEVTSRRPDYAWLSSRREEPARLNHEQDTQIRTLVSKMSAEECAAAAVRADSILATTGSHLAVQDIPGLVLELLGCSRTCTLLASCKAAGRRTVTFALPEPDDAVFSIS